MAVPAPPLAIRFEIGEIRAGPAAEIDFVEGFGDPQPYRARFGDGRTGLQGALERTRIDGRGTDLRQGGAQALRPSLPLLVEAAPFRPPAQPQTDQGVGSVAHQIDDCVAQEPFFLLRA